MLVRGQRSERSEESWYKKPGSLLLSSLIGHNGGDAVEHRLDVSHGTAMALTLRPCALSHNGLFVLQCEDNRTEDKPLREGATYDVYKFGPHCKTNRFLALDDNVLELVGKLELQQNAKPILRSPKHHGILGCDAARLEAMPRGTTRRYRGRKNWSYQFCVLLRA